MASVTGQINREHYKTLLGAGDKQIIADEPLLNGGEDEGFSPSDLLASALVACTCITLRMYADRKGWNLEHVEVDVHFVIDNEKKMSTFERKIHLTGNLSEDEKQRLLVIAEKCFIHKVLTQPIHIQTSLQ